MPLIASEVSPQHLPTTIKKAHAYNMNNHLLLGSWFLKSGDFLKQQVIKQMLYIIYVLILLFNHKQILFFEVIRQKYGFLSTKRTTYQK